MKLLFSFLQSRTLRYALLQIIFLSTFIPQFVQAELVDRVVAVVNNDVITLSEVENEASTISQTIARNRKGQSLVNALTEAREKTLDAMISRKLVNQRAKQLNIRVSEREIDDGYDRMQKRSSLGPAEFRKKLEESGMSLKLYRKNIRAQILQAKLISFDVRSKIAITDEMILDYYDKHYTTRVKKGSYYLLQMGFTWDTDTDSTEELASNKEGAEKRAERVYKLIQKGEDFKTLARKFSDLPSASDGGDIGVFTLDEMASVMRKAVAPLKDGELSKIIETPTGFQFFKLLSDKNGSIVVSSSYDSVKEKIKEKLYQIKLKDAYEEWVNDLKEKAYIQKL